MPRSPDGRTLIRLVTVGLLAALGLFGAGCGSPGSTESQVVASLARPPTERPLRPLVPAPDVAGDPAEGRRLFVTTGCAGCHTARGVPAATGVAGPNLTNVVLRPTLAGQTIPMAPDTLTRFLLAPGTVKPGTTMPDVGLTPEQAQSLTAFLYSQPYNPRP